MSKQIVARLGLTRKLCWFLLGVVVMLAGLGWAGLRAVRAGGSAAPQGGRGLVARAARVAGASRAVAAAQAGPNFVVNTLDNVKDGTCGAMHCSLRDAIVAANSNSDASTITFSVSSTIDLDVVDNVTLGNNGLPVVSTAMTIAGGDVITVQRSGSFPACASTTDPLQRFRIFFLSAAGNLTLDSLTITRGCYLAADGSRPGGGIRNDGGTLNLNQVTLNGNRSSSSGGGIYNDSGGTLNIANSTISNNAAANGGGILTNLTTVNIVNSTLSGNMASGFGGAHHAFGSPGNPVTVNISNSTIANNSAGNNGSALVGTDANYQVRNTIFHNNTGGGSACFAATFSGDFNLRDNTSCPNSSAPTPANPVTGFNTTLALNPPGPTQTHALSLGSNAVNAAGFSCQYIGSVSFFNTIFGGTTITTDQIGQTRSLPCDIGAFEAHYALAATAGTPQSTTVNTAFTTALQATLTESGQPVSGVTLTFTAPMSGPSASFPNGNTATTNASGQASVNATANGVAGLYQVTAGAPGLTAVSFNLSNTCPAITAAVTGGGTICSGGTAQVFVNLSGGSAPYTVTLTNGGGTQTGAGPFTFNLSPASTTSFSVLSAVDANGCPVTASGSALLTVNLATALNTPPASQTRIIGQSVSFSAGATGTNLSYQWRKGGQAINGATQSSYTINAVTLADAGSYDVVVNGACGQLTATPAVLTVNCPNLTLASLPNALAGTLFNASLSASPAGGNYQFSSTDKPAWLTLASNGALSGTPPATGTFSFNVSVTGFGACTQTLPVTLTVNCPTVSLTPTTLPNGEAGALYSQPLTATPAGGNYIFNLTNGQLPPGVTLSAAGSLSGTPTQTGSFNFRVSATGFGNQCSSFRDYQILVTNCTPITLNPASLNTGTVGASYSQAFAALPAGSYSFAVTNGVLPSGLSLNAATGALSGTPTTPGTYNLRITATQGSCSGWRDYTLTINCASTPSLGALPAGTAGMQYHQTITVTPSGSYSFSLVQGNLPAGLTLSSAGVLGGLPSLAGAYNFSVRAQAANGCSGTQSYTLVIGCPTLTLSTLATPVLNQSYQQTVSATPAGGNYNFTVTAGVLPSGLTLNPATGSFSGTPSGAGTFNFTFTATGFGACTGSRAYSLVIDGNSCLTITLRTSMPTGQPGQAYSQSVAASPAGNYSYAVTAGALPPGLTLYERAGLLFGYPTTAGTFNFTIEATNPDHCTGARAYSVSIGGAAQPAVAGDFDGDGKSDLAVWRGQQSEWLVVRSTDNQLSTMLWGAQYAPYHDVTATADYDGDGKMDWAVFRQANGHFYVKCSANGVQLEGAPGAGDTPVAADYDGDGKADFAVWQSSTGAWTIQRSGDNTTQTVTWGLGTAPYLDVPVVGDYDGDGKADIAVFRRGTGTWFIQRSSDGAVTTRVLGLGTDVPVAGDYDGDGKADLAVWRGATGHWYVLTDNGQQVTLWGAEWAGDVAAVGDYDGDGKTDLAVWRAPEGKWYVRQSSDQATRTQSHGQRGDQPVTAKPQQ